MTVSHQCRRTIQFSQCHSKPVLAAQSAILEFVADGSSLTRETNSYSFIRCCNSLVLAQEFILKAWHKTAWKRSTANYCQSRQRLILGIGHLTRQTFTFLSIAYVLLSDYFDDNVEKERIIILNAAKQKSYLCDITKGMHIAHVCWLYPLKPPCFYFVQPLSHWNSGL